MLCLQNWGGGNFCGTYATGLPAEGESCLVPYNTTVYQSYDWVQNTPYANETPQEFTLTNGSSYMNGTCYQAQVRLQLACVLSV